MWLCSFQQLELPLRDLQAGEDTRCAVAALKIEPNMEQRYASNIATRFLTNYHYKRTRLDDELSSQIFDNYLELLMAQAEGTDQYRTLFA